MDGNNTWPQPPLGGVPDGAPGPAMGGMGAPGAPLGDWQPERDGDAPDAGTKKKKGRGRKKKTADEAATRTVANKRRIFAIALGVLGAGALFLGTAEAPAEEVYVAQTARPLTALTAINSGLVQGVALPAESVEDGAFTGSTPEEAVAAVLDEHDGAMLRYPLAKGRQLHADAFLLEDQLAVDLGADERLISLDASIARAVGGDLRVGDRVDIIGVDADSRLASLLVSDVEVVDITLPEQNYNQVISQQAEEGNLDKTAAELLPGAPIPGTYTLRVRTVDAPRVYLVSANAELFLAYRGPGAETLAGGPLGMLDVMCGLDQPDLPASYIAALPEACRDTDGNVDYSGGNGTTDRPADDLFVPSDEDESAAVDDEN